MKTLILAVVAATSFSAVQASAKLVCEEKVESAVTYSGPFRVNTRQFALEELCGWMISDYKDMEKAYRQETREECRQEIKDEILADGEFRQALAQQVGAEVAGQSAEQIEQWADQLLDELMKPKTKWVNLNSTDQVELRTKGELVSPIRKFYLEKPSQKRWEEKRKNDKKHRGRGFVKEFYFDIDGDLFIARNSRAREIKTILTAIKDQFGGDYLDVKVSNFYGTFPLGHFAEYIAGKRTGERVLLVVNDKGENSSTALIRFRYDKKGRLQPVQFVRSSGLSNSLTVGQDYKFKGGQIDLASVYNASCVRVENW